MGPLGSSSLAVVPLASLEATGGAAALTLNTDAGSYTLTGSAAQLVRTRNLTTTAGAYSITGTAAGLSINRVLTAAAGSYALTGVVAKLTLARNLLGAAGSYAINGVAADLTYTPAGGVALTLDAAAGSYTITGVDASFTLETATATVIGRRTRKRKSRIWEEPAQEFKSSEPEPLFDAGMSAAAIQAIQERLDRMRDLQGQIEAAGTVNKALRRSLDRELARLNAEEDDEDDVETLLLS